MRRTLSPVELADLASPHRWEEQRPGDTSRHGCRRCGGERWNDDGVMRYRAIRERVFSTTEPPCESVRGKHIETNPENARRALRVQYYEPSRELRSGERCPSCGYGSSVSEQVRFQQDVLALKNEVVPA